MSFPKERLDFLVETSLLNTLRRSLFIELKTETKSAGWKNPEMQDGIDQTKIRAERHDQSWRAWIKGFVYLETQDQDLDSSAHHETSRTKSREYPQFSKH
jgi:hypothetical protein